MFTAGSVTANATQFLVQLFTVEIVSRSKSFQRGFKDRMHRHCVTVGYVSMLNFMYRITNCSTIQAKPIYQKEQYF